MRNSYLRERTATDIDKQVAKILRGLGNPPPPLQLADVRELLHLDRGYYSTTDSGVLRDVIHKLTVAGKQILRRPSILLDVVRKCSLKALFLPDQKRILIDADLPKIKQRWGEAHEIGHSVIPWHDDLALGDDQLTLTPTCHAQVEAEANYAAGRLLFLRDRFRESFQDTDASLAVVRSLGNTYGNSMTTTLWRTVEYLMVPAVGVVSEHLHRTSEKFDPVNPCRYFIRSRSFAAQFGQQREMQVFESIKGYCGWQTRGPLGCEEIILTDDAGVDHVFFFETFFNCYEALTLGVYRGVHRSSIICVGGTISAD